MAPPVPPPPPVGAASPLPISSPPRFVPRVFISHSSIDNAFGLQLAADLAQRLEDDTAVWYDASSEGLMGGDEWQTRIQLELTERNVFIVILSPDALLSPWVAHEIRAALAQAVGSRKVLIPVLHRSTEQVPPFLAAYQWISFLPSRDYHEALDELVADVWRGESRLAETAQPIGERLGPPFDLGQLPSLDHFIGREQDIAWVIAHLTRGPTPMSGLASIAATNGFAGIGKSTLAAAVIQRLFVEGRFPDGLAVVRCNGLTDPTVVLRRVLERFAVRGKEVEEASLATLGSMAAVTFAATVALILLDNVEPNWPIELVVGPLRAAGVALLLTSRQDLPAAAVPQEASLVLQFLPPDQARELFAQSYGRFAWQDLTPAEQQAAAAIVEALGYHTLAVKLAGVYAARRKGRRLESLADEYKQNPRLALGLRDGSEAVGAVLDASYASLPEASQHLFVALAAFATTDVGREAVLALAYPPSEDDAEPAAFESAARASLDALEDLHLVDAAVNETMPGEESDAERVRLHPLVQTYVQSLFERWTSTERATTHRAVATWYAEYVNAVPELALLPDEANILAALEWAQAHREDELVAALCTGLQYYWRDRGKTAASLRYLPWGVGAATRIAEDSKDREDRLRASRLSLTYGAALQRIGQLDAAEQAYQEALTIRRELTDRKGEGAVLAALGQVARARGQLEAAEGYYQQALAIDREEQDRRGEGVDLYSLALIAEAHGDLERAEALQRESLGIAREVQDGVGIADSCTYLGEFLITRRDKREEGCGMLAEAARLYEQMGVPGADEARATAQRLGCG
jgi:tetratricopeptide (TPR) repeat protein